MSRQSVVFGPANWSGADNLKQQMCTQELNNAVQIVVQIGIQIGQISSGSKHCLGELESSIAHEHCWVNCWVNSMNLFVHSHWMWCCRILLTTQKFKQQQCVVTHRLIQQALKR